jgi:phospholipid transport system transporter-binding protein
VNEARLIPLGDGRHLLEGALDFTTVSRLAMASHPLFKRGAVVEIDLAGVTSANSAGLALLLDWLDVAGAREARLTYRNLPDSLVRIAAVSNLDALLPVGDPAAS